MSLVEKDAMNLLIGMKAVNLVGVGDVAVPTRRGPLI
jgi:hypothetical protein